MTTTETESTSATADKWRAEPKPDGTGWWVTFKSHDGKGFGVIARNINEREAKLIAAAPAMADALENLWKLIENDDLVRNIEGDGQAGKFISQAMAITCSLMKAQAALTKAGRSPQ